ncbi:CPXCG motif-containing cysteine-rich protein [Pseudomarimonas arenosa]|uniref:CPXCG motif-containing cysteine-rich protein n=1 Tax=Pseudomarimonas arenosa TaxID=2774145 RepID=A0AAW3ZU81_9GAMM|nr:CPXCG motif-containing cysteine-rich protein [Pseudomarimonas arenosa]MBD8527887.1 CPXCG motif-containing cysteine-rich protein [Pseudomarimonas arenosa]
MPLHSEAMHCPWCGEPIELWIEPQAEAVEYSEDCSVCCRPIRVQVAADYAGGSVCLERE